MRNPLYFLPARNHSRCFISLVYKYKHKTPHSQRDKSKRKRVPKCLRIYTRYDRAKRNKRALRYEYEYYIHET